MTREHIKFGIIRTQEELQSLAAFAKSFDHNVGLDSIRPIFTIERGDQMIGYFNVLLYPIVAPSLHPAICTPRDFNDALAAMRNHYCFLSIGEQFPYGTSFMAVPTNTEIENSVFERNGFVNTKKEIWQCIPK
jgi:hypothetical protein